MTPAYGLAAIGILIVGTSVAMAEPRTMTVENRTYSFEFSEKLRFVGRSVIAEGFPQTTWEFRTADWIEKGERGVGLIVIETDDDLEGTVQRFQSSDEVKGKLEFTDRTLFYTSVKGGVIMAAKSRCAEPCMLLIFTSVGADPESRSLGQEMIDNLKASLLADNFLSVL